jgi:hypothetical protein
LVALIVEAAQSARREAGQIRDESIALRRATHANVRLAHEQTTRARAVTAAGTRLRLAQSVASPWSGLRWRRDDEALQTALVPVD